MSSKFSTVSNIRHTLIWWISNRLRLHEKGFDLERYSRVQPFHMGSNLRTVSNIRHVLIWWISNRIEFTHHPAPNIRNSYCSEWNQDHAYVIYHTSILFCSRIRSPTVCSIYCRYLHITANIMQQLQSGYVRMCITYSIAKLRNRRRLSLIHTREKYWINPNVRDYLRTRSSKFSHDCVTTGFSTIGLVISYDVVKVYTICAHCSTYMSHHNLHRPG